jgi:hypothetical protein
MVFHVTILRDLGGLEQVTDLGDYSIDALRGMLPQWAKMVTRDKGDKIVLERVF